MKRYQGATASFAADERSRRRDPGSRFRLLGSWLTAVLLLVAALLAANAASAANVRDADVDRAVTRGLDWLKAHQSRLGNWTANGGMYPTSITAMSGIAFLCEGSTTTQGKYAPVVRKTMDYLLSRSRANGLIGDPHQDDKYTYGHGFSMLFLSQLLGEEEDAARRKELVKALTKAVKFTGYAQAHPAVGATSAPRTNPVSTRARPPSRRCRGCGVAATRAFRFPRRSSTRPSSTSKIVRIRTTAAYTIIPCSTAAIRPFQRRPSPVCSTPATTTTSSCPSCWPIVIGSWATFPESLGPLALCPLLLRPGALPRGRAELEGISQRHFRPHNIRSQPGRLLDPGHDGPGLYVGHESDDFATSTGRAAHLPTLRLYLTGSLPIHQR